MIESLILLYSNNEDERLKDNFDNLRKIKIIKRKMPKTKSTTNKKVSKINTLKFTLKMNLCTCKSNMENIWGHFMHFMF